jgi:uncharacterized membrane protein YccC
MTAISPAIPSESRHPFSAAFGKLKFLWSVPMRFTYRTVIAGLVALYIAMWMQLDVPRWALWTVIVIAPPVRGTILRKTLARLAGTIIGCAVSLLLAGLFPQDRVGYVLSLGIWLGICGFFASQKRGLLPYGAIVAGFTVGIVAAGLASHPEAVFDTALNRGAETVIGILCAMVASVVISDTDDVPSTLARTECELTGKMLDWADIQLAGNVAMTAPFTASALQLDMLLANGFAERPAMRRVRQWIDGLPTALLSLQSSTLELARHGGPVAVQVRADFKRIRELLRAGAFVSLHAVRFESNCLCSDRSTNAVAAEATDALAYILACVQATLSLEPPTEPVRLYPPPTFSIDRRPGYAVLVRCAVGTPLAFLVWDATAWTSGPSFLVYTSVMLILSAMAGDASGRIKLFLRGAMVGVTLGIAALFLLLPFSDDFLWLATVLALALIPGVWAQISPKLAGMTLGFNLGFLLGIEPTNFQHYSLAVSINAAIGMVAGIAFGGTILPLLSPPPNPRRQIRLHLQRVRRVVAQAFEQGATDDADQRLAWETIAYDQVQHLIAAGGTPMNLSSSLGHLLRARAALRMKSVSRNSKR